MHTRTRILGPDGRPAKLAALEGYDAVTDQGRRKSASSLLMSEDRVLDAAGRVQLVSTGRAVARNFTIAAWAIRKHLDYVSTFEFQSRSGDDALDQRIEELMEWWERPENCDVAERHGLPRALRIAEERRTVDGDIFVLMLSDGRVQWIEGDRVRTPGFGALADGTDLSQFIHGVRTDENGKALQYCVCKRTKWGGFALDRVLDARWCIHHFYSDRFDQVRGISPLAGAINTFRDCYEGFDLALAKMKVAQLFGLVLYRQWSEAAGETSQDEEGKYKVDFGKGPVQLDLDLEDKAEFLETHSPSTEFQSWAVQSVTSALKGLDIPYSFYDEAHTNYSGARQALQQYEQSAEIKRGDNRRLLNRLRRWRLQKSVLDGVLELPGKMKVSDLQWEHISRGVPWIDPQSEINAKVAGIAAAITCRQDVCKEDGRDFFDTARKLAAENKFLTDLGLPTELKPATQITASPREGK